MKPILLAPLLLTGACSHTGMYALSDRTPADQAMTFNGTLLSVEADGDFLLETSGRLLLVDVGDTGAKVELGDRVTVTGRSGPVPRSGHATAGGERCVSCDFGRGPLDRG